MQEMAGIILGAGSLLALAGALWVRSLYDFRIHLTAGQARFSGSFPPAWRGRVTEFLREQCPNASGVIRGRWRGGRTVRLSFRGNFPPEVQQRARNFLGTLLRPV
jgi:hypothetical protein